MNCSAHHRSPYHDFLGNNMQHRRHLGGRDEPQVSAPLATYRCAYCDRSFMRFQALGGHHAAHAREMRKQWQQEEKAAASSDFSGSDPRPLNRMSMDVADDGRGQANSFAASNGIPTVLLPPLNTMNRESCSSVALHHPQLVDFMEVQSQGIRVALWDVIKTTKLREENNTVSLEVNLGCSEELDLTLRL